LLNSRKTGFDSFFCTPGKGGAHEKPQAAYCTSSGRFVGGYECLGRRPILGRLGGLAGSGG